MWIKFISIGLACCIFIGIASIIIYGKYGYKQAKQVSEITAIIGFISFFVLVISSMIINEQSK